MDCAGRVMHKGLPAFEGPRHLVMQKIFGTKLWDSE